MQRAARRRSSATARSSPVCGRGHGWRRSRRAVPTSWRSAHFAELREAWPEAEVVDLAGGTLLPGLIDAHNHFLSTGESLASLGPALPGGRLSGCPVASRA